MLPYVFTSPWADIVIRENDKVYLFGHPTVIQQTLNEFAGGFVTSSKGELGLKSNIPLNNFSEFRKSMRQGFDNQIASMISEGDEAPSTRYTSVRQIHNGDVLSDQVHEAIIEQGFTRTQESKMEGSGGQLEDHIPT